MPVLNEIKRAYEIDYKGRQEYIWLACSNCGKERWVENRHTQKSCYTGLCLSCVNKIVRPGRHKMGVEHHSWKGGRFFSKEGYIYVRVQPDDFFYPMARHNSYAFEHRLVMAKHLGRNLHFWEIVHHKGTKYPKGSIENRSDNRIENLQLISDDRHKQISILENRIIYLENILRVNHIKFNGH